MESVWRSPPFLLAGVIGAASFLWASEKPRQPPILDITQSDTRLAAGEYYVPFTVTNVGGETAESVQVVAELRIDGEVVDSGEQILEFLSSQETAEGAFIFTHNPQGRGAGDTGCQLSRSLRSPCRAGSKDSTFWESVRRLKSARKARIFDVAKLTG